MRLTISGPELAAAAARLREANQAFAERNPGTAQHRQPVHTVYLAAPHFRRDTATSHGELAVRALATYAPDAESLGEALALPAGELRVSVYGRLLEKLRREPVEDLRVDFEDGYGVRADDVEDRHAVAVATEAAAALHAGSLPCSFGIRVKPLTDELADRSIRTLDLFVTALIDASGGRLPPRFVLTLPKVTVAEQIDYCADALERLEARLRLPAGALRMEVMVETPQALLDAAGTTPLRRFAAAARGRLVGAHLGVYDYTASLGIAAAHQRLRHPACDFARQLMQVAFAGTDVGLSDGSTGVLPEPPYPPDIPGSVNEDQRLENRRAVHGAWKLHYDDVRHSLAAGFYQSWDLHPAQLVSRFAAVFAFFLEGAADAARRLRTELDTARTDADAPADPHAGQAALDFLRRGIRCGASTEDEILRLTGLAPAQLHAASFAEIAGS